MKTVLLSFLIYSFTASASSLHVEQFSGIQATVNSFIFYDDVGSLIVDATRNSKEAKDVAKVARAHGDPKVIFITHGHPDHYYGLGALKKEFPDAKIFVAGQDIKNDILDFSEMAAKNKWLSDEPLMWPKSKDNPNGFDFQNEIQVLQGNTLELPGGEKLQIITGFKPTEALHETLLFSKDLNSLFASDLVYSDVHLWLGGTVDLESLENWKKELKNLKIKYSPYTVKIYPGHGEKTDARVFDADLKYLNDILKIAKNSETLQKAKAAMITKYPTWKESDFILDQSMKNIFKKLGK